MEARCTSACAARPADPGVDIWRATLAGDPRDPTAAAAILAPDERARMAAYRDPALGLRFARGRSILRRLLAGYLQERPEAVPLRYGMYGKPALGGRFTGSGWEFSVSHSGDLALVAVTRGAWVGVDVEALRPLAAAERLAAAHLSPAEWARYRELPAAQRSLAFLRAWTAKEAYVKAEGVGLARPLRDVEVTGRPGAPGQGLRVAGAPDRAAWSLQTWTPLAGFAAALVVAGRARPLRFGCWPQDTSGL